MRHQKIHAKDVIFYVVMLAFPIAQFCLFYIGVNGRSFLYAFQNIEIVQEGGILSRHVTYSIQPLIDAFEDLTTSESLQMLLVSIVSFLLTYFIGTSLALFFSYFIYKKLPLGSMFKVFLFLPSILSAIVMATIFRFFVDEAIPAMQNEWFHQTVTSMLADKATRYGVVIFYHILISFGTSVLMYSNAMSGVSTEIVEAAKIDGCGQFGEFFHIMLPSIFPTITTFAITSVAAIFTNQISLFAIYGNSAPVETRTLGYFLYVRTLASANKEPEYPVLCAMGLIISAVAIPLTLLTKYLLEKYGPSED